LDIICNKNGQQFYGGDGLVTKGVEATLKNIGRLGKRRNERNKPGNHSYYDGRTMLKMVNSTVLLEITVL